LEKKKTNNTALFFPFYSAPQKDLPVEVGKARTYHGTESQGGERGREEKTYSIHLLPSNPNPWLHFLWSTEVQEY
jgi:hypothetical protein